MCGRYVQVSKLERIMPEEALIRRSSIDNQAGR